MRKAIVFGTVAAFCMGAPAHAADLGGGSLKDEPAAYAPPAVSWAGLYVGGSAGFGKGDLTDTRTQDVVYVNGSSLSYSGDSSDDLSGGIYGAHLGYNWQFGNIVAGLEAGINGTGLDGCTSCNGWIPVKTELEWYAIAVARLGYAQDGWLLYGFGGLAWAHANVEATDNLPRLDLGHLSPPQTFDIHGGNFNAVGWTAGFGVEYAFNRRLSMRLEYSHVDLGEENVSLGSFTDVLTSNYVTDEISLSIDVVKVGASYKLFDTEGGLEPLN